MSEVPELIVEVRRLSDLIDRGVTALRDAAKDEAQAEHDYRHARAQAWLTVDGKHAKEREDEVNAQTASERLSRDLAAGLRQSALEALRSRRQQLSALQSVLAADREEAAFGRTAPREVA